MKRTRSTQDPPEMPENDHGSGREKNKHNRFLLLTNQNETESEIPTPEIFQGFLPELWDTIFHFGWFSDFKALLLVSRWFNAILWRHIKHLDFPGAATPRFMIQAIESCRAWTIKSFMVTSYGTLHIDAIPENLKEKFSNRYLVGLSSLVVQRWSLSPAEIAAKDLPSLTHLTVISASSSSEVGELAEFSKLRSLTLRFVTEPILQSISRLPKLECLNIGNLSEVRATAETIEYTSKNGKEVTDATFHYLLRFTNLRKLCLGGLGITDRSLEKLTCLTSLKHLDLTWCQRISDHGLSHLTCLSNLRRLELWHSGITEDGIKKFKSACSKYLSHCKIGTTCVNKAHDL